MHAIGSYHVPFQLDLAEIFQLELCLVVDEKHPGVTAMVCLKA